LRVPFLYSGFGGTITNYERRQNFGKNYSVNIDRNNRTPKARMGDNKFPQQRNSMLCYYNV
jgi:hypothetical protein